MIIRLLHIFALIFFILLILVDVIKANQNIIEGLDSNDPLYISKTSAGDIQTLKKQMQDLQGVTAKVSSIEEQNIKNSIDLSLIRQKGEEMKAQANKKYEEQTKKTKKK
jgi:hypothetical protein